MKILLSLSLFLWLCCLGQSANAEKPHFLIFLSDDHSLFDCSVYGARDVRTPNMQKLADAGMVFDQAYIDSPACAPSRAALLIGLMPARNGAEANHSQPRADIKKLPAYLKALGYEVAAFGKVAYGSATKYGFDHSSNSYAATDVETWLKRRKPGKPLCLFVGTKSPHVAWPKNQDYEPAKLNLPPSFVDTPETRHYRAMYYTDVSKADRELGQVMELGKKYLGENTLSLYTSDHGAQWPFGKWNLYDAGIRSPFIAAWAGVIHPGSRNQAMIFVTGVPFVDLEIALEFGSSSF